MKQQLKQELRSVGASADEADELAGLAWKLQSLDARLATQPKASPAKRRWQFAPLVVSALLFLVIGSTGVAAAQTSLPGNWLYPVKRLSENTAVAITPSYRATLMMRRADEVRLLIARRSGSDRVLATLAAYDVQASAYTSKDYPAFAYCKTNLQQAASIASATSAEKQQIDQTLARLNDVD